MNVPRLLVIEVSPRSDYSISRKLTARFLELWREACPQSEVTIRDLAADALPYIEMAWVLGAYTPPETHSHASIAAMKLSDDLIAELQAADFILIGTPMHNATIPATLKAYIDHIVRVGITVTDSNEGMVLGKKVAVLLASGGNYAPGTLAEQFNHATPYLRTILGLLGMRDMQVVLAGPTRPIAEGRADAGSFVAGFDADLKAIVESWVPSHHQHTAEMISLGDHR